MIPDSWGVAGFTSGDGGFFVKVAANKALKIKYQVNLVFYITQDSRDEELINCLVTFFNCGHTYKNRTCTVFNVHKFADIYQKIIPFFQHYNVKGVEFYDFIDFCNVAELIAENQHLTASGFEKIIQIK